MPEFEVMKFKDYKKEKFEIYEKGVLTVTLKLWQHFYKVVEQFQNYKDYVWRGQRCENWSLNAKFDRIVSNITDQEREEILAEHLKEFKNSIVGRRGNNPPELNDEKHWALGQHYGMITPLMDWTLSPFVAAFFAFAEKESNSLSNQLMKKLKEELSSDTFKQLEKELGKNLQTNSRVVYGLNKDIVRWFREYKRWTPQKSESYRKPLVEFPDLMLDENYRLLSQRGLFTISLKGEDIKTYVRSSYGRKKDEDRIILVEIKIPNKERKECLKSLNLMNINHMSLFPDIYGATKYCNLKLENKEY